MAKTVHDEVLDAALAEIAEANLLTVCSAQPTTRTEAVTTFKLADVAMTPGNGNGDYTISDGDTNGRKLRIAQQTAVPVDSSGTATYIALVDDTRLLLVTTCTSQALTAGNTVTVPAFDDEIADPV